jgi:hypothetical protein
MPRVRAILLCIGGAMALLLGSSAQAAERPTDTDVKAAFLPRFARYVTWPPAAAPKSGEPFVLCVIGNQPFGSAVEAAARSQSVDGRRIAVRKLPSGSAANGCQIVFVTGTALQPADQVLAAIGKRPVLTVTDGGGRNQRGIIHFTVAGGRVRFFIDQAAAEQRGLQISSRLLALAVGVRQ